MKKTIKDVMTKNVKCASPDTSLQELASTMKDLDVGGIPICEKDRLTGIVTDRDIVLRCIATGKDPKSLTARDVQSSPIVFCREDEEIEAAARLMEVRQVRRLVVLNHAKRLVGIVSLGDIAVRGNEELSAEILEKVSEQKVRLSA